MCLVAQLCPTLCDPVDRSPPGSSVHRDSPGKNTGVGCHALLQGNLPNPGIKSRSPTLQADSLPSAPPGKPFLCNIFYEYFCVCFYEAFYAVFSMKTCSFHVNCKQSQFYFFSNLDSFYFFFFSDCHNSDTQNYGE